MEYDEFYSNVENYFGDKPEIILEDYHHLLNKENRVLDIGIGQGRNALFLARKQFQVDGIDLSKVAIESVSETAGRENSGINAFQCGFQDFKPSVPFYSGILLFGLIQVLPWDMIDLLVQKINRWTSAGSLVFVTAFTTEDPKFPLYSASQQNEVIGKNSFIDNNGIIYTFLEKGEMKVLFKGFRPLYYWEGMGPKHQHGDGPVEQHGKVEAVFQR